MSISSCSGASSGNVSLSSRFRCLQDERVFAEECRGFTKYRLVYITTNELGIPRARQILKEMPRPPSPRGHIGFSGWHNFDIAAVRRSDFVLVCDISPAVTSFMNDTLRILRESPSRGTFIRKMVKYFAENRDRREHTTFLYEEKEEDTLGGKFPFLPKNIALELIREGSWLASEEGFEHISQLAREDKIVAITLDILNLEKTKQIAQACKIQGYTIDTLYLNNMVNFFIEKGGDIFAVSSFALTGPETIVINSLPYDRPNSLGLERHQDIFPRGEMDLEQFGLRLLAYI